MRTLYFLLIKEFKQIFRNKSILRMVMVLPVIQLLVLPLAADYEVKNINIAVIDNDHSIYSQQLTEKISESNYFNLVATGLPYKEAYKLIETDEADLILEIPHNFKKNLLKNKGEKVFIAVNAINGTKANLGGAYLQNVIGEFGRNIQINYGNERGNVQNISITYSNWYNPLMSYKVFMVPGILATLVTLVGGFLAALNIVKEKEIGTIEQINVTPIKKHHFILGKLIPFWILGNVVFTLGLIIAWLVYGIIPLGSLLVLYSFISVYLLAVLGFGLLISTYSNTQQQAMFIMYFFVIIFIMMGGLFTSVESMPDWAKVIVRFNPLSYLIEVLRMIILKGSSFTDVLPKILYILLFAVVLNTWAVLNYKKQN